MSPTPGPGRPRIDPIGDPRRAAARHLPPRPGGRKLVRLPPGICGECGGPGRVLDPKGPSMIPRCRCGAGIAAILIAISIAPAPAADDAGPSSRAVVDALRPFVERHALAGAVTLVADKDRVLALDAVGFADVDAGRPMRPDALFWIASQSKPITAAAVMMLVDEGKVRLDAPIADYLPEFRDLWMAAERDDAHILLRRPSRPITVRDLLSHTSGLPFRSAMEVPTLDGLSLRDAARSYAMTPLQSEPGTKYAYSNAGINAAGRIVEVVSGIPFEEFLDKRLFGPLGMKDTTFWPDDKQLARLAKSYKPNAKGDGLEATTVGQLRYPLADRRRHPMPAGGLFSTAEDVGRFCRMMLNGGPLDGRRYLSESSVAEMTRKQTPASIQDGYGLGFSVGPGRFGHGGAYATDMTVDTRRGLITVFLVQHAGFPDDGKESLGAFRKAAEAEFARPKGEGEIRHRR